MVRDLVACKQHNDLIWETLSAITVALTHITLIVETRRKSVNDCTCLVTGLIMPIYLQILTTSWILQMNLEMCSIIYQLDKMQKNKQTKTVRTVQK